MKHLLKSYTSFTRAEKAGLAALSVLLVLLLLLNVVLRYGVKPKVNDEKAKNFIRSWEHFKNNATMDSTAEDQYVPGVAGASSAINLNTADSVALLTLKGIGPVTAHKIMQWRAARGPFTDYAQIKALGRFSTATFDTLKAHSELSVRP